MAYIKMAAACAASLVLTHAFAAGTDARRGADVDASKFDENMAVAKAKRQGAMKWINGRDLPLEGKAFSDVAMWYDRLPSNVTHNVNAGVRNLKRDSAGMQFRFSTDSGRLSFRWTCVSKRTSMGHMPATGVSGIDVYRRDKASGKWRFVKTGRISGTRGALDIDWNPGDECLVNLPLYNGIAGFSLGIEPSAQVKPLPPRSGGNCKPVVFYGTSITQGACASRPGMSFVNIVGRELDVPVVNLGFSGSGVMEAEMSDHLAAIDASCYVLDCLWNMGETKSSPKKGRNVDENYERFIRNLRAKRPDVPIVMAGKSDVFGGPADPRELYVKGLYEKLKAEGWRNIVFLPGEGMYPADGEGSVDGVHPNDYGMMFLARAYGAAVKLALSGAALDNIHP